MNYFEVLVWPGGGVIGVILWGLSITMVAIIVQNFLMTRRQNYLPEGMQQQIKEFLDNKQYREAIEQTSTNTDALSAMVRAALLEAPFGFAAMERALDEQTEEITAKNLRYCEWLNLLGNVGPMVGLLGTVWGLIITFFTIARLEGQIKAGDLAAGIGIKLVCTFLGLVVAIPSLSMYGIIRNRIDTLTAETASVGAELISTFRRAKKAE